MKKTLFPIMTLLLIVGLTGCAGIKNSMRVSEKNSAWNPVEKVLKDREKSQTKDAKPVSMAAIWADSVVESPGENQKTKGFVGRIYFYDDNSNAIHADGELIVYGFDDSIKDKAKDKPDVKFVFKKEDFQSHYSESGVGASYRVWLAWEPEGGVRKSITLIPVFKTADGRLLKCGSSINNLKGTAPPSELISKADDKPYKVLGSSPAVISQASYQPGDELPGRSTEGVTPANYQESDSRIRTTNIQLTPSMAQRMAKARNFARHHQEQADAPKADLDLDNVNRVAETTRTRPLKVVEADAADEAVDTRTKSRRAFGQPGSFQ